MKVFKQSTLTIFLALACAVLCSFQSCTRPVVKIAFIAVLSGTNASLGVEGRDGFEQALGNLDWQGFKPELRYFDDRGQADRCLEVVDEALAAGYRIFVFQTTSGASLEAIPRALSAGALCLSATVSASDHSGKDDLFFRTALSNGIYGKILAEEIVRAHPDPEARVILIGDMSNENYVRAISDSMSSALQEASYRAVSLVPFDGTESFSATDTIAEVQEKQAEALVLCTNPIHAALLAQNVRKQGMTGRFYLVPWAVNDEFIRNAGRAAEGTRALSLIQLDDMSPAFRDFATQYRSLHGKEPSYFAQYGYEVTWILQQALTATGDSEPGKLGEYFRTKRSFSGLVRTLILDEFGDGSAKPWLYDVRDGAFVLAP